MQVHQSAWSLLRTAPRAEASARHPRRCRQKVHVSSSRSGPCHPRHRRRGRCRPRRRGCGDRRRSRIGRRRRVRRDRGSPASPRSVAAGRAHRHSIDDASSDDGSSDDGSPDEPSTDDPAPDDPAPAAGHDALAALPGRGSRSVACPAAGDRRGHPRLRLVGVPRPHPDRPEPSGVRRTGRRDAGARVRPCHRLRLRDEGVRGRCPRRMAECHRQSRGTLGRLRAAGLGRPSHGLPPCGGAQLEWTRRYLAVVPA